MNLDTENPATRQHIGNIVTRLQKQLNNFIKTNPDKKITRSMKMLLMATSSLSATVQEKQKKILSFQRLNFNHQHFFCPKITKFQQKSIFLTFGFFTCYLPKNISHEILPFKNLSNKFCILYSLRESIRQKYLERHEEEKIKHFKSSYSFIKTIGG